MTNRIGVQQDHSIPLSPASMQQVIGCDMVNVLRHDVTRPIGVIAYLRALHAWVPE